jgi:hypothetical protein
MKNVRRLIVLAMLAVAGCSSRDRDPTSPSCTYAATATRQTFDASGGSGTIAMVTTADCSWSLTSDSLWLTFAGAAGGTGNANVAFTVATNAGAASRTAVVSFPGGGKLSIVQSGTACSYAVSPTSVLFDTSGGTKTVELTTPEGCAWTAAANQPWIRITRAPAGSGSASIDVTVDHYASATSRSGIVTIGDRPVNVTQEGTGCTIGIDPRVASIAAAGGSGTFDVTATDACAWTVESQNTWIAVTANATGSGPRTVTYTVAPNSAVDERVGRITVADQTLYLTQAGAMAP